MPVTWRFRKLGNRKSTFLRSGRAPVDLRPVCRCLHRSSPTGRIRLNFSRESTKCTFGEFCLGDCWLPSPEARTRARERSRNRWCRLSIVEWKIRLFYIGLTGDRLRFGIGGVIVISRIVCAPEFASFHSWSIDSDVDASFVSLLPIETENNINNGDGFANEFNSVVVDLLMRGLGVLLGPPIFGERIHFYHAVPDVEETGSIGIHSRLGNLHENLGTRYQEH